VSGSIVSPELRARVRGVATPIAVGFGRLGLTPNHLTLIGFGIAVVAAAAVGQQAWLAAGVLVLVGGAFDLFDGALARATGRTSRLGAFMDSVADRAGEGVVYVGIVAGCLAAGFSLGAVLAAAAMAAAFMVSYVRAKSESLGFASGTGMAAIGLAPREMRIVILTLGLLVTGVLGFVGPWDLGDCPNDLLVSCLAPDHYRSADLALATALGLITVLATVTTIQRIVHVIRQTPQE
jgi:CDP-diacylglycerol--glycerol-3-phosphate 3-phosphatidyltransferase